MPPRQFSRHALCSARTGARGALALDERQRYTFRNLPDNITHRVQYGDSLWTLAARYFQGVERPAGLWWVIADFQPEPVFDATIRLTPGSLIVVPSLRTVLERILNEDRRGDEVV